MNQFTFEKIENKNEMKLVSYDGCDRYVKVPDTYQDYPVTIIGEKAFLYGEMEHVTLPDTIRVIEDNAFAECEFLKSIDLSKNLKEIGNEAFCYCDWLSIYEIPDSVEIIGRGAFEGCPEIEEVILPSHLKKIGKYAFDDCDSLLNVYVSDQVKIGLSVFDKRAHVIVFSKETFELCRKQEAYNVKDDDPLYTSIDGVLYNKDCTTLIRYPLLKKDNVFVVPPTVTKISNMAFSRCSFLIKVIMHDNINDIGKWAFAFNEYIEEVTLPSNLEKIEDYMFTNCMFLSNMIIPDTVKSIGKFAFFGITEMASLVIPRSVTKMSQDAFDCCDFLVLKVYDHSYALKYAQENELDYEIIKE